MTRLWSEALPITVTVGEEGRPLAFLWLGRPHPVRAIVHERRVDIYWWQNNRAWRHYFTLATHSGLLVTIYHDLLAGHWYLQQLYD
jgi:hypothetical protein